MRSVGEERFHLDQMEAFSIGGAGDRHGFCATVAAAGLSFLNMDRFVVPWTCEREKVNHPSSREEETVESR